MRYASFKCGPWGKPGGTLAGTMVAIAERLLPQANPDFEKVYEDHVVTWWFEIDKNNIVQREVAFDADGRPVAAAPLGENHGIFTDLDSAPKGLGAEVDATSFEEKWNEARDKWFEAKYARPAGG